MDVEKLGLEPAESTLPALGFPTKFVREGLTFDDVLLVPAESSVLPNDVSTATRLTRTIALEIPVVSAAMDTVTEARLAIALAREGGIGIVHRNLSVDDPYATKDEQGRLRVGAAVGVGNDALERAGRLADAGVDVIVVDTAHGHSRGVLEVVRTI